MISAKHWICLGALLLACGTGAAPRQVYVAVNGNDANPGTIAAPLASLEAARNKLRTKQIDTTSTDGASEITIAAWVNPDTKGASDGVVTSTGDYFGLIFSASGAGQPIEFRAKTFDAARGPDYSCPTGQWTHVVGVWKAQTYIKLYINGVEVVSNPATAFGLPAINNWYIGANRLNAGQYLDGSTRDVHLYTRALTPTEIATLATYPSPGVAGAVFSRPSEIAFDGVDDYDLLNEIRTDGGAVVLLRGGRYPVATTLALEAEDSGQPDAPIVYKAYPGEEVVLDGSRFIPTDGFSLVSDAPTLARLHPDGQSHVFAATLTDPLLINLVKNPDAQLSLDDRMLQQSRFPNIGFTFGNSVDRSGEVLNTQGTDADPKGALFTPRHTPQGNWNAELIRIRKARCRGYVSAQWKNETLRIHSVTTGYRVTLMDGSSYGFSHDGINRPFVDNLLCEIDEPGEWYFDDLENKLYIYPPDGSLGATNVLGVWAGPDMFTINGNYIRLENLVMQCAGNSENAFINMYGISNVAAGCTFRYSPPGTVAFNIYESARSSGAHSCNFFDINNAFRLYGGSVANNQIIKGNCFIENCHFTQIWSKSFYGKVAGISGAGNLFRNNLAHNHNGQIVTVGGVEHVVEYNEIFNTGVEEGDGGSFYSGASFSSWDNLFRYNFWHHIICIPELYARAAIYSDDGDCGEQVLNNVFYKASEAFRINQGAGHIGSGNASLEGIMAVNVLNGSPSTMYNNNMNYLNTNPLSTDKDNILGRGMRDFGVDGWDSTISSANWNTKIHSFWRTRYPRFDSLMNTFWVEKTFNKYNWFTNTVVYSNTDVTDGISAPSATKEVGTQIINNLGYFEDPSVLNFKYKTPLPSWARENHFELIGLYTNEYRPTMPDKDWYRANVKARWDGVPSKAYGSYNPDTINDRIYYNTGKMIFGIPDAVPPVEVNLSADAYDYDLGPRFSAIFSDWHSLYPEINGDIHWTSPVNARDRGTAGGANDANRDHIFGTAPATLEHKIANGFWKVTLNMGDATTTHDNMRVFAEGELMVADKDAAAGEFAYAVFTVPVRDGSLTLTFDDNGGTDPEWVVNRMSLLKVGEVVDLSKDRYDYDPGPVGSLTLSGYTVVTPDMNNANSDVYWASAVSATDRTGTSANNLNRDFIHGTSPATLHAKVPNGPWKVTMNIGDPTTARDNVRVTMVDGGDTGVVNPAAGTYPYLYLYGTVSDGYLTLTFSDDGGTDPEWLINRITLLYQNARPVAVNISTNVMGGKSVAIPLSGSDADGPIMGYHVVDPPQHGTFDGTTYTADLTYAGTDSFTYAAYDAYIDSPPATVTIAVVENPDYDNDGIDNKTEYAFGGDPLSPASQGTLPRIGQGASGLAYIYLLRNDPALSATTTVRTNLLTGAWEPWTTQSGSGPEGDFTFYTNTLPTSAGSLYIKTTID